MLKLLAELGHFGDSFSCLYGFLQWRFLERGKPDSRILVNFRGWVMGVKQIRFNDHDFFTKLIDEWTFIAERWWGSSWNSTTSRTLPLLKGFYLNKLKTTWRLSNLFVLVLEQITNQRHNQNPIKRLKWFFLRK